MFLYIYIFIFLDKSFNSFYVFEYVVDIVLMCVYNTFIWQCRIYVEYSLWGRNIKTTQDSLAKL